MSTCTKISFLPPSSRFRPPGSRSPPSAPSRSSPSAPLLPPHLAPLLQLHPRLHFIRNGRVDQSYWIFCFPEFREVISEKSYTLQLRFCHIWDSEISKTSNNDCSPKFWQLKCWGEGGWWAWVKAMLRTVLYAQFPQPYSPCYLSVISRA